MTKLLNNAMLGAKVDKAIVSEFGSLDRVQTSNFRAKLYIDLHQQVH